MDKKINLDEIIKYQMRLQNATDILYMDNGQQGNLKDANFIVKKSMLEFGKQLLELAAENAKIIDDPNSYCGNTGSEYPADQIISKQSILDIINQIE